MAKFGSFSGAVGFAVFLIWGVVLLPQYTLSPAMYAGPGRRCRIAGPDLQCAAKYEIQQPFLDPLAPVSQELPADEFFHSQVKQFQRAPKWNPYIGSGYPIAFDQMNGRYSPTRRLLQAFPGDATRDLIIFLRILIWTTGIALAVWILGIRTFGPLFVVSLAAATAPYFIGHIDIVFLDIDCLTPWFVVLLLGCGNFFTPRAALLLGTCLGALTGLLSFSQSQACIGVFFFLAFLCLSRKKWKQTWPVGLAVGAGFLLAFPSWAPALRYLSAFASMRSFTCVASLPALTWSGLESLLAFPVLGTHAVVFCGTLSGLALILSQVVRSKQRGLLLLWSLVGLVLVAGMPSVLCRLPVISGLRFGRHFFPAMQALFIILVAYSAQLLAQASLKERRWVYSLLLALSLAAASGASGPLGLRIDAFLLPVLGAILAFGSRRQTVGVLLLTLSLVFLSNELFFYVMKKKGAAEQAPSLGDTFSPDTVYGALAQVSAFEDRRHVSPTNVLFPNWSQAFGILDLRLIYGLYPQRYYRLNAALFDRWHVETRGQPPFFFGTPPPPLAFSSGFERLMVLHRVSLLSFDVGATFFSHTPGPYTKDHCRLLRHVAELEAYVCDQIGGIAYFPVAVRHFADWEQELAALRTLPLAALVDAVFVIDSELPKTRAPKEFVSARGSLRDHQRLPDELRYNLQVEQAGVFAVADTYFPGWKAYIDNTETEIFPVNQAFKGVWVPKGNVSLKLVFAP